MGFVEALQGLAGQVCQNTTRIRLRRGPLVDVIEEVACEVRCGIISQPQATREVIATGARLTHYGADGLITQEVHCHGSVRRAYTVDYPHEHFTHPARYEHYSCVDVDMVFQPPMFRPHRIIRCHRVACDRKLVHGYPESLRHDRAPVRRTAIQRVRHGSNAPPRSKTCRVIS